MNSRKGHILCTEDDADTRDLIMISLEQAGYEVICSDDAGKALELIKTQSFDLCLTDSWMPGVTGEEFCQKIREFNSTIPILFYTGAGRDEDKARAIAAGAQSYLVKPVLGDKLTTEVARLIADSQ